MKQNLSNAVDGAKNCWTLAHHLPTGDIGGIIIETEAYMQENKASHS